MKKMKKGTFIADFYNFEVKVKKKETLKNQKSQVTLSDFYCLIY